MFGVPRTLTSTFLFIHRGSTRSRASDLKPPPLYFSGVWLPFFPLHLYMQFIRLCSLFLSVILFFLIGCSDCCSGLVQTCSIRGQKNRSSQHNFRDFRSKKLQKTSAIVTQAASSAEYLLMRVQ